MPGPIQRWRRAAGRRDRAAGRRRRRRGRSWRHGHPSGGSSPTSPRAVGVYPGSDVRVLGVRVGEVDRGDPAGPHGPRRDALRREVRRPRRRPGADRPAERGQRPVRAAHPGLHRRAGAAPTAPSSRWSAPPRRWRSTTSTRRSTSSTARSARRAPTATARCPTWSPPAGPTWRATASNLHDTLDGLSQALTTLADGRQDLFGSVANLQRFTTALARSDQQVRGFNQQLADVAEQLAGETRGAGRRAAQPRRRAGRGHHLRQAEPRGADRPTWPRWPTSPACWSASSRRSSTSSTSRRWRCRNLNLAYNPRSGTLDTRDNAMGPYDPAELRLLADGRPASRGRRCRRSAPPSRRPCTRRGLPMTDQLRKLLKLPPGAPATGGSPPGARQLPRCADRRRGAGRLRAVTSDPTLGGILRGTA